MSVLEKDLYAWCKVNSEQSITFYDNTVYTDIEVANINRPINKDTGYFDLDCDLINLKYYLKLDETEYVS